jgi:hypothetical protein
MKRSLWFLIVVLFTGILLGAVAAFNYWADPAWLFDHEGKSEMEYTYGFNERQQKTNRLAFYPPADCDCVILGSSRTTYVSPEVIKGYHCINLAANNMGPDEYLGWIKAWETLLGKKPMLVVIGLDFWGSNANEKHAFEPAATYVADVQSPLYRFRSLLSFDVLKQSIGTLKYNRGVPPTDKPFYDREGNKHEFGFTEAARSKRIQDQLEIFRNLSYGNYVYRDSLPIMYQQLRDSFPDARFVVFTTPVSQPLLTMVSEMDLWDERQRWIDDAVTVFDTVHHFMYRNTFSMDTTNFYDSQHTTSQAAQKLLGPIFGEGEHQGTVITH